MKSIEIKKELERSSIPVKDFDIKKGGVYVEMTEDPRGWYLGDKTRKKYKATIAQIAVLTNMLVTIAPILDGVKVKVHNPDEVGRMLLSKNDDVGSSIEYAKHDGSNPMELSAQPGQHVCIESITNGSYIRAQIFPGEDIKIYKDY